TTPVVEANHGADRRKGTAHTSAEGLPRPSIPAGDTVDDSVSNPGERAPRVQRRPAPIVKNGEAGASLGTTADLRPHVTVPPRDAARRCSAGFTERAAGVQRLAPAIIKDGETADTLVHTATYFGPRCAIPLCDVACGRSARGLEVTARVQRWPR